MTPLDEQIAKTKHEIAELEHNLYFMAIPQTYLWDTTKRELSKKRAMLLQLYAARAAEEKETEE